MQPENQSAFVKNMFYKKGAEMAEFQLEVYDPSGSVEVTQSFAPRLNDLNGKTICELSHAGFQSERTFARIRELLQKRFPTLKIIPYTEFAVGRAEMESEQNYTLLAERGADAVITGNAA